MNDGEWRTEDGYWRKRRGGRPYGSWHRMEGGGIVNLHTASLDEARAKAKKLAAAVGSTIPKPSDPPRENGSTAAGSDPPRRRRSPLRSWAVAEGGDRPTPPPPPAAAAPAPPPKPELTPAMVGLADGLAGALAKFNAMAGRLVVQIAKKGSKAPPLDDDEIDALEKTYATGLKEMMLLQGLQWWHILAVQNGAMLVRMYGDAEVAAPPTLRPVPSDQTA